jgi:hypothetical protein
MWYASSAAIKPLKGGVIMWNLQGDQESYASLMKACGLRRRPQLGMRFLAFLRKRKEPVKCP